MGWSLGDRFAHLGALTGFGGGSVAGAGTGAFVRSLALMDSGIGEGEGGMMLVTVFGTNSSSCPSVGTAPHVSITAKSPGLSSSTKRTSHDVISFPVSTSSNR